MLLKSESPAGLVKAWVAGPTPQEVWVGPRHFNKFSRDADASGWEHTLRTTVQRSREKTLKNLKLGHYGFSYNTMLDVKI